MARAFDIKPLEATFGAVVTGITLAALDEVTWRDLHAAWLEYALLIFPGQHVSREEQIAFAKLFGRLEFELSPLSNVKEDGTLIAESDTATSSKSSRVIWAGTVTVPICRCRPRVRCSAPEWCRTRVAKPDGPTCERHTMPLNDDLRAKVENHSAHHSLYYSQAKLGHQPKKGSDYSGYGFHDGPVPAAPPREGPPETGRKSLLIGRHAYDIPGMNQLSPSDSCRSWSTSPVNRRASTIMTGSPGDVVIWDNRACYIVPPHGT